MTEIKVLAAVKFNNDVALVLDKIPELTYTKYGDNTIIGTNGLFYLFYGLQYDRCQKAFGGSKFKIVLDTGEVIDCNGQWWDSVTNRAVKELNINKEDNKLSFIVVNTKEELNKCYVFSGYYTLGNKAADLLASYTGKVYEYHEYAEVLKQEKIAS